jgi:uncharacterized protein YdaU (DUF1376 family)
MSKSDTWMPLYIGDYLADTMHLNAAQHGAYLLLLMHQWRTGPLVDDDAQLATIARCDLALWRRAVGPVVRRFFDPTPEGLAQKRLATERLNAMALSAKLSDAGKTAAAKRWNKDANGIANASKKDANGITNAYDTQYPSDTPSPSPSQKEERETSSLSSNLVPKALIDAQFDEFWKSYPRKTAKDSAKKAFVAALKRTPHTEILAGVKRGQWNPDPRFIPYAATWLNQGRWQDETLPEGTPSGPREPHSGQRKTGVNAAMDWMAEEFDNATQAPEFRGETIDGSAIQ